MLLPITPTPTMAARHVLASHLSRVPARESPGSGMNTAEEVRPELDK